MTKFPFFVIQSAQPTLQLKALNPLAIDENPSHDIRVSFLVLPNVPGLSWGPPGHQNVGTTHAKWQIWAPKICMLQSKIAKNLQT